MTFANIEYLLLLLLLLPFILWHFLYRPKYETKLRTATTRNLKNIPQTLRTRLLHLPFVLRMLFFILVVIILARPQLPYSLTESETEGIDIMIGMDISVSMLTPDLEPNRIEAAKQVVYEFISSRPNDNIGLTLFGGEAFTQCPMTTDHTTLLKIFNEVSCDLQQRGIIADGTAIGMGITNAVSKLVHGKAKSKVVILLTDGVNNTGEISPLTAAEIAKKNNIRIYTIAVGKKGKVKQPVAILPNGEYYYQTVESEMDSETLEEIAEMTGGLFFHAESKEKLRQIYKDIDQLEKTKLKIKNYHKQYEFYQPFAFLAFLVLLIDILLRLTWLRRILS
ncbi:MAG: VWA domain-containing protein [Bacteroidaceae bacterium]|nr:VWA domain-containing protein [Bacteroidaceae bacterium]